MSLQEEIIKAKKEYILILAGAEFISYMERILLTMAKDTPVIIVDTCTDLALEELRPLPFEQLIYVEPKDYRNSYSSYQSGENGRCRYRGRLLKVLRKVSQRVSHPKIRDQLCRHRVFRETSP